MNIIPGTQKGSNSGGIHVDLDGNKHYVKFPSSNEQSHVEVAASKLYKSVGLTTLDPIIHSNGSSIGVSSPYKEDLSIIGNPHRAEHILGDSPEMHIDLALAHHMACILKNHDAVGMEFDNIATTPDDNLIHMDQGGSMHFRAMGGAKDFGPNVHEEIESFKVPRRTSAQVFGLVHPLAMQVGAKIIKDKLTDSVIDSTLKEHGLDRFASVVKARRDGLVNHYAAP